MSLESKQGFYSTLKDVRGRLSPTTLLVTKSCVESTSCTLYLAVSAYLALSLVLMNLAKVIGQSVAFLAVATQIVLLLLVADEHFTVPLGHS